MDRYYELDSEDPHYLTEEERTEHANLEAVIQELRNLAAENI